MTPGHTETADGMSQDKIDTIIEAMRHDVRQIQPVEAFDSTSSVNNSEGFFQL